MIRMELLTPLNEYTREKGTWGKDEVIHLGIDICKALEICQKYDIIHRDIKPENIFVADYGNFKLGDFGIARIASQTSGASTRAGTNAYMAPEIYRGEHYGKTVDLYSLGLVLYRLLNDNRLPFMPQYPAPLRFQDRENAQAMRLSGASYTRKGMKRGNIQRHRKQMMPMTHRKPLVDLKLLRRNEPSVSLIPLSRIKRSVVLLKLPLKSRMPYPRQRLHQSPSLSIKQ